MLIKPPINFLKKNITLENDDIYKNYEIEIDDCLVNEIQELWKQNIHTLGCCCGHGKQKGFIQVEPMDQDKMLQLNYQWYHEYPEEFGGIYRFDAFIPKTKCQCKRR